MHKVEVGSDWHRNGLVLRLASEEKRVVKKKSQSEETTKVAGLDAEGEEAEGDGGGHERRMGLGPRL